MAKPPGPTRRRPRSLRDQLGPRLGRPIHAYELVIQPPETGRLRLVLIEDRDVAKKILDHLGIPADPPRFAPSRGLHAELETSACLDWNREVRSPRGA